jgi:RHS repeat-associated protein
MLGDLTYQYDAAGNRVGVGGAFARSLIPTAVPSAAYDSANRQLAFGATTMTFDDTGNLATLTDATGTTTYTWDSRNRLTGLTGPTASAQFAYDGHGRRAQKTVGGVSTQFQYDGLDATRELGGAEEATYLRTLNIDETLVRTITGDPAYFLADGLGSTVALADAAGGTPTTYTYAPFGETAVSGAASSNPFHLTGREDDGFGLYYYRARYYDPTRSRFVSEDPFRWVWLRIGELGFFTYSGNNPLKWVDPFGLFYFARRPLGHLPWIPIASQNPLDDYLNTELSHEHGFFEDASGGNVGFGPHGRFTEDPTGRGYRPEGTHYDDARMRRALQNISDGSYSNLLWKKKNNCQDWADRLRAEYRRLEQEDRKKK